MPAYLNVAESVEKAEVGEWMRWMRWMWGTLDDGKKMRGEGEKEGEE